MHGALLGWHLETINVQPDVGEIAQQIKETLAYPKCFSNNNAPARGTIFSW
jgi:hypothetical protein